MERNITSPEGWKDVTFSDIGKAGGSGILRLYPSLANALETIYGWNDTHDTKDFRRRVSRNYWKDPDNIRSFVKQVEKEFSITERTDWYRVSQKDLFSVRGGHSLVQSVGLLKVLQLVYPEEQWDGAILSKLDKRSAQFHLFKMIQEIFQNEEVIEEYSHPELSRKSGFPVEFDVYVPSMNLAFEYHGEHHYEDIPAFGPAELYQLRDQEKLKLCAANNILLVTIPYWYKSKPKELREYIYNSLPKNIHSM